MEAINLNETIHYFDTFKTGKLKVVMLQQSEDAKSEYVPKSNSELEKELKKIKPLNNFLFRVIIKNFPLKQFSM